MSVLERYLQQRDVHVREVSSAERCRQQRGVFIFNSIKGSWIHASDKIEEPFESDRHFVDATSWADLEQKVRFTSYCGRKDNLENFAYLPTTIIDLENGTTPVFAQWSYRIICHPLKNDLPLNRYTVQVHCFNLSCLLRLFIILICFSFSMIFDSVCFETDKPLTPHCNLPALKNDLFANWIHLE